MFGHNVQFPNSSSPKKINLSTVDKSFGDLSCDLKENAGEQSSTLPPSYDSIFGQFKDTSACSYESLKKVLKMLAGTAGCTISLLLLLSLPMSMIVVGSVYKDDCPIEPFIPIYLIVGGSFGVLKTVFIILQRILYGEESYPSKDNAANDEVPMAWLLIDSLVNLFLFVWFIAGNIWVYSKFKPHFVPPPHDPLNYCNGTVYLFAFWVITLSYIIMGLICFCTCCLGLCASCTAYFVTSSSNNPEPPD